MTAGAEVELYSPQYVERAARTWSASSMVPKSYLDAEGRVKEGDVFLSCNYLAALGADPRTYFTDTYVVNAKVSLMAEAQRALLARHGYDFDPDFEHDDEHAVVRGRRVGETAWKYATVTMAEAKRAGWTNRNPNYGTQPGAMMIARATTRWVSHHAPEVKRELAAADRRFGFQRDASEVELEAPAEAPDGATIPGPSREPAIDADVLADLMAEILELPGDQLEWFRREWRDHLGAPNLQRGQWLTRAHGRLLRYMLDDAQRAAALAAELERQHTDEPIPVDAHDDDEPAADQPLRYDPDDAGRPFGND